MKRKEEFITREVAGEYIMMPVGETALKFNGLIMGNEVSLFIWNNIENVETVDEMVQLICDNFEVEETVARQDCTQLIHEMKKAGWIE